jgi:uncharacterized protein (TIGR02145 family)
VSRILKIFIVLSIAIFQLACSKEDSIVQLQPSPDSLFTDVEGNIYKVKKIGSNYWMIENFRAVKNANGQDMNEVYVYDNNISNTSGYGRLYTWNAAVLATPTGWHLPTKEEWEELINAQGGTHVAGGNLKETGTSHWNSPNTGATNSSGLAAVGSGFRGPDGIYYDLGKHGSYWGTANSAQDPFCVYIYHNSVNVISEVSPIHKTSGIAFAVRYVKN